MSRALENGSEAKMDINWMKVTVSNRCTEKQKPNQKTHFFIKKYILGFNCITKPNFSIFI